MVAKEWLIQYAVSMKDHSAGNPQGMIRPAEEIDLSCNREAKGLIRIHHSLLQLWASNPIVFMTFHEREAHRWLEKIRAAAQEHGHRARQERPQARCNVLIDLVFCCCLEA